MSYGHLGKVEGSQLPWSVATPWQPTRSVVRLGEQRQRREDISLRDGVFVPARKALGGLQLRSGQVHSSRASPEASRDAHSAEDLSWNQIAALQQCLLVSRAVGTGMPTHGWRWLHCGFVSIVETGWPNPLPANGCCRPGGGSGEGKGPARVWPHVQLQLGKEMVKQGYDSDPCGWRWTGIMVAASSSQRAGGHQRNLWGPAGLGSRRKELCTVCRELPAAGCFWGMIISTASREARADPWLGGPPTCAAHSGTWSAVGMRGDG